MTIRRKQATSAIHGSRSEKGRTEPVTTPIYQTTTYQFPNSKSVEDYMVHGVRDNYIYARYGNPGQDILQERFALLENAESSLFFASGMGAITTAVNNCIENGNEILTIPSIYGQTFNFFNKNLPRERNVNVKFIDIEELYDIEKYVTPKTKLIYFETPANPNLQVVDIEKVVGQAKKYNLATIIDNTFATPINQNPLDMGIDIVVHSATKYIGGHSDVLAGVVAGSKEFITKCEFGIQIYGAAIDPFAVFLLTRSLKTLEIRVQKQNDSALELAKFLNAHPKVEKVFYPGLENDPWYETAKKQMKGFGGMINFVAKDGKDGAITVADNLDIAMNATSLGGVETLVSLPIITSHVWLNEEELKKANISKGMVRLSLGLEDIDDLKADFDHALNKIP